MYDNPEVLVVIAAGNAGTAPDGVHKFNTVGTPATAKNALTVGACGSRRPEHRPHLRKLRPEQFSTPRGREC